MRYENIIVTHEEGVTTITLNRPDKLNALDANILKELVQLIDAAREDDASKVMIITGAGEGFCSGADLTSTARGSDPKQSGIHRSNRIEPFVLFRTLMKRLRNFHKPLLIALNGIASAGDGLGCHFPPGDISIATYATCSH